MSQALSPSQSRTYGLALVCRVWKMPRSTVYARRKSATGPRRRPGPVGPCPDDQLVEKIREVLAESPFVGEGYRKVWARLRARGVGTSQRRVLRLMRAHGLLAPTRQGNPHGPKAHDGTIIAERPDQTWGTDATTTMTGEGQATIFILVDHCTAECLGIHAARRGTRFEALEPVREAVRSSFGSFEKGVAEGVTLRHDNGSQYVSRVFLDELTLLGIDSSPSFVREPEGNGCSERFIRTLKEQLLWLERFDTVEELLAALRAFKDTYNSQWLIQRHGHVSPSEQRRRLTESQGVAA